MYWNSENVRHIPSQHTEGRRIVRASEQLSVGIDSQSPHIGEEIDGPTAPIEDAENEGGWTSLHEDITAAAGAAEEVEGDYGMMFTRWPDANGGNGGYIMCHDCGTEKYFFGDMFENWIDVHSTPGPGGCPTLAQSAYELVGSFAGYDDFADCKSQNSDKGDSDAYCGEIKHRTEDKKAATEGEDPKRRKQPGGQAANWGAGQLTPQRIRDEMALGQGVNYGDFSAVEAALRIAGFQDANWRDYPNGRTDSDYETVHADYEDALYPYENPRARIIGEESYGEVTYRLEVMDGSGQLVLEDYFDTLDEAKTKGNKQLEKLYKGEGKLDPDQGKFFTTPGKGKLFSNHTAAVKTAMNWWDAIEDPRHVVAGWNWDDHLSGYVAEGMFDFECSCGAHVAAPGHTACTCGKMWNSYPIVANGQTRLVAREVPVREGVILADRRTAAEQRYVRDEEYWGLPAGTPIKPGQKPQGDSGGSDTTPDAEPSAQVDPDPEPTPEPEPAPEPAKPKLPPLTEEQLQERVRDVQAKVDKALEDGFETQLYYAGEGGRGTYTAERRRQQRHLIGRFWAERGADHIPREGKAIMSGGLGGSGKTTILKSEGVGIDQGQYLTINADDIKEMMVDEGMIPEIEGCSPMELAALVHEESSDISQAIALEAYRNGTNVIWDLTMGSTGSIEKRLNFMREAGYDQIDAVFVDIPVEKSVERAISRYKNGLERYRNGKGDGGRYVPPEIIRKNNPSEGSQFNSKNREVFESLKDRFDNAVVYDNSGGPGEQKKVNGFGRWARVRYPSYTIPDWAIY